MPDADTDAIITLGRSPLSSCGSFLCNLSASKQIKSCPVGFAFTSFQCSDIVAISPLPFLPLFSELFLGNNHTIIRTTFAPF